MSRSPKNDPDRRRDARPARTGAGPKEPTPARWSRRLLFAAGAGGLLAAAVMIGLLLPETPRKPDAGPAVTAGAPPSYRPADPVATTPVPPPPTVPARPAPVGMGGSPPSPVTPATAGSDPESMFSPAPLLRTIDSPALPKRADWPCRTSLACPEPHHCNLSSGACERRVATIRSPDEGRPFWRPEITGIYPLEAGQDDLVTIDGVGMYYARLDRYPQWRNGHWQETIRNMVHSRLYLNGQPVPEDMLARPDETRLVVRFAPWMAGPARIDLATFGVGHTYLYPLMLRRSTGSPDSCSPINPPASGKPGSAPFEPGPHAAAFADSHTVGQNTRLFYPARCGGLRRPPAAGRFPVALLLAGDGTTHLNYNYLCRFLATWGIITIVPQADDIPTLERVVKAAAGGGGQLVPFLAGSLAADPIAVIAHSRGGERTLSLLASPAGGRIGPLVLLAPVHVTESFRRPALIFAAEGDPQAIPPYLWALFKAQTLPGHFIAIEGGNHSQFTDVKHWESETGNDAMPGITRNEQHAIVQEYALAFLQHHWRRATPFSDLLAGTATPPHIYHASR